MSTEIFDTLPSQVQGFLLGLIEQSGMSANTVPELQSKMLDELAYQFQTLVNTRILENLSEELQMEYQKLLASNATPELVSEFYTAHLPDSQIIIENATSEFASLYTK